MPSAVARTATLALTQATLPHVLALAAHGLRDACAADAGLAAGLQGLPGVQVEPPQSNMVFVDLTDQAKPRAPELLAFLKQNGVLTTGLYRLRLVTHLDVDAAGIDHTVALFRAFFLA